MKKILLTLMIMSCSNIVNGATRDKPGFVRPVFGGYWTITCQVIAPINGVASFVCSLGFTVFMTGADGDNA